MNRGNCNRKNIHGIPAHMGRFCGLNIHSQRLANLGVLTGARARRDGQNSDPKW